MDVGEQLVWTGVGWCADWCGSDIVGCGAWSYTEVPVAALQALACRAHATSWGPCMHPCPCPEPHNLPSALFLLGLVCGLHDCKKPLPRTSFEPSPLLGAKHGVPWMFQSPPLGPLAPPCVHPCPCVEPPTASPLPSCPLIPATTTLCTCTSPALCELCCSAAPHKWPHLEVFSERAQLPYL